MEISINVSDAAVVVANMVVDFFSKQETKLLLEVINNEHKNSRASQEQISVYLSKTIYDGTSTFKSRKYRETVCVTTQSMPIRLAGTPG